MRALLRCLLIISMIAGFAGFTAYGAPLAPLGTVLQAQRAHVGDSPLAAGTTLYQGDRLSTENNGTIQARLGQAQISLPANSVAEVNNSADRARLNLVQGSAIFQAGEGFELAAVTAIFRSKGAQPVLGRVTVLGPDKLEVTCERGELEVTIGDEVRTVEASESYEVTVDKDQNQGSGKQPEHAGRSRWRKLPFLLILIGAPTALAIFLLTRSPSAP